MNLDITIVELRLESTDDGASQNNIPNRTEPDDENFFVIPKPLLSVGT